MPETRDWHVTHVPKQPLGRQTPGRQPQFNPNTLPLSPVRQHQGAVSYPEFNKIYLALKQLQEEFGMPLPIQYLPLTDRKS